MRTPLLVLICLCCASLASAQQFDPAYRFQVLPTEHFRIYFHQGEAGLAARLAPIAEDIWQQVNTTLGRPAPARTEVILIDQTDLANGWAAVVPRNVIAIYAAWPAGSDSLKTDDWLRLVLTHEFTHIVHLDRSEGWARVVRSIFGRTPFAFPNMFLPAWQIEGLAVYQESALTGEGRMHAGDFRAIVGEAARERNLLPLDRVNGGLTRWPGGGAQYAYGASFHAFLAERYGADKLRTLADQTAQNFLYLGSRAFKSVFSTSLGTLWREFETAELAAAASRPTPVLGRRLTHHNFGVTGPRFAGADVYYSVQNADEWPALYRIRPSEATPKPERVTTRFLGSTLGVGRERLYFDQQERRRNAGLYSDLYSFDPASGTVRRLTHDARLIDPDLSPDGRSIVAVEVRPGQRNLVIVHLASADKGADIKTLVSAPESQFNAPRWSPDGQTIAVESQPLGEHPRIVLVNPATSEVRVLAGDDQTRWVTPTWRRDGAAVIAAAAAGDGPFNLFELTVADSRRRQLTHTTGGATWPEISPDGSHIVYVGRTATGFDVYEMPYRPSSASPLTPSIVVPDNLRRPAQIASSGTPSVASARPYSPFPTLLPTSWWPVVGTAPDYVAIGAQTAGSDVLGYHAYAGSILQWVPVNDLAPDRGPLVDWDASYAYTRWRATGFVSSSRDSSFRIERLTQDDDGVRVRVRDTDLEAGVVLPIARVRTSQLGIASFLRGTRRTTTSEERSTASRAAARFGWSFRSAAAFGNSISPERGIAAGVTAELVREAFGSDADATTLAADIRVYLPGFRPHHVVAVRLAGGRTNGDRAVGRRFLLGGGDSNARVLDFGSEAMSLFRGFPSGSFAGTRVALANADYRLPLLRVERGRGTWPIFLHTIHGSVFTDLAHVWTTSFSNRNLKSSVGAELSADIVFGFFLPVTATAGVARGHDGSGRLSDQTTWYARLGYAF